MPYWIGVDIGGTFTDLVLYDEGRQTVGTVKTPTTADDPGQAVLRGLSLLGVDPGEVSRFLHGTTIATNTVLEEKGANVSLLTTRGHRDAIEVGRGQRPVLYDIRAPKFVPLVPRRRRYELDERTLFDGTVSRPVDPDSLAELAREVRANGSTAVAVCFLHSYANSGNERAAAEWLAELLPDVSISVSSEVLPEFREYERFSTTALNAYVAPMVGEPRGIGMLRGIELVADRATGAPFARRLRVSERIAARAFEHGLIILSGVPGSVDGVAGDHLLIAPPLVASVAELDRVVDELEAVMRTVQGESD